MRRSKDRETAIVNARLMRWAAWYVRYIEGGYGRSTAIGRMITDGGSGCATFKSRIPDGVYTDDWISETNTVISTLPGWMKNVIHYKYIMSATNERERKRKYAQAHGVSVSALDKCVREVQFYIAGKLHKHL